MKEILTMAMEKWWIFIIVLGAHEVLVASHSIIEIDPEDMRFKIGDSSSFQVSAIGDTNAEVSLWINNNEVLHITSEKKFTLLAGESRRVDIQGDVAGQAVILANTTTPNVITSRAIVRVTVQHSNALTIVSQVVGWIYLVSWSLSFYPQTYVNWRRESVVGLNFDFVTFNIIGFVLYSLFNCGLRWIPQIEDMYYERHPDGRNPVMMNDIVFALHAVFATSLPIIQCIVYERGDQSVSLVAKLILLIFGLFLQISFFLAGLSVISWLEFLNYCSYVKLCLTIIKYSPQAYMNYRRKSTVGWSIGMVFLDVTGGIMSMLQMIFNAINYNDWESISGDPTKFGLGFFSVMFDILFLTQHYYLYRDARKNIDPNPDEENNSEEKVASTETQEKIEISNEIENAKLDTENS